VTSATQPAITVDVESLDIEAHGVARHDGKVVFVHGGLPGERLVAQITKRKTRYDVAQVQTVLRESVMRVRPRCPNFGVCGGCSMQHLDERAQLAIKQRVLEDQLKHLAGLRPQTVARPIAGVAWNYRCRARLTVRYVEKRAAVLVGFHEKASRYVTEMSECHVLPRHVSDLIVPLRAMIEKMSIRTQLPQIEVAQGDSVLALVFRVLTAPTRQDRALLAQFGVEHQVEVWLQPKGPETSELLDRGQLSRLSYSLPEFGVTMPFRPTDFTQVNPQVNRVLVKRAVDLLAPQPGETVVDLFCGLGNFSLPIATRAAQVLGIEGSSELVRRAIENAKLNGLAQRTRFITHNLFRFGAADWSGLGKIDRLLIDPPRDGALEIVKAIAQTGVRLKRIVYVSCNPATLARDAGVLVGIAGYTLQTAGVVNMFPHTSHVESIALFTPPD
jgi:23S rRNA (uracil1939-C5)-methyltransferase